MRVNNLIFQAIVGSQSYGLATETSDTDIKGVYMQDNDDFLIADQYIPFKEVTKDESYYELRNFLQLLSVGNPTAIELLFTPEECILHTTPEFELIRKFRSMFMTKKLYDSFGGYAANQLRKAHGLNKKFNWEQSRIQKKDILDFCKIIGRGVGKTVGVNSFLKDVSLLEIDQSEVGLTKIDGFRDSYKVYLPLNPAREGVIYRGIMKEGSNEVRGSEIPKDLSDDWVGVLYFNREAYSTHCRDYKSYKQWEKNRNENRYRESREGKRYDGKNLMHTARLIIMIEEFHKTGIINLDMSEHRKKLLSIKTGLVDLKFAYEHFTERADNISKMKAKSDLPKEVSIGFIQTLELHLRKL